MFSLRSGYRILLVSFPAFLLALPVLAHVHSTACQPRILRGEEQSLESAARDQEKQRAPLDETQAAKENPPVSGDKPEVQARGPAKAAQEQEKTAADSETLRKATQNPVASLISVPMQNNANFDIGPYDRTQNVLNVQPVIPVRIADGWNLIMRIIQPIITQPDVTQNHQGDSGFGDMNPSFFFSPAKPGKLIWGAGPAVVIPTATARPLGQGKLSVGPTFVALIQPGKWTIGVLVNNVWSVAGKDSRPDVHQMLLQYFVNYNLNKGYYLTVQPIITANWKATGDERWVVPFGGGVGRIMKLGFQPINIAVQVYGNAVRPPGSSPVSLRLQLAFLYPKAPRKS